MSWLDKVKKVLGLGPKPSKLSQKDTSLFFEELSKFMDKNGNTNEAKFCKIVADAYRDPSYVYMLHKAVMGVGDAQRDEKWLFVYTYRKQESPFAHHKDMLDYAFRNVYYEVADDLIRHKEHWEKHA